MKEKAVIVCVKENQRHLPESILRECFKCHCGVWCMPWHKNKKCICFDCVLKLDPKTLKFGIDKRDVSKAATEIGRRKQGYKYN